MGRPCGAASGPPTRSAEQPRRACRAARDHRWEGEAGASPGVGVARSTTEGRSRGRGLGWRAGLELDGLDRMSARDGVARASPLIVRPRTRPAAPVIFQSGGFTVIAPVRFALPATRAERMTSRPGRPSSDVGQRRPGLGRCDPPGDLAAPGGRLDAERSSRETDERRGGRRRRSPGSTAHSKAGWRRPRQRSIAARREGQHRRGHEMPEQRRQVVDTPAGAGAVDVENADDAAHLDEDLRLMQVAMGRHDGARAGRVAEPFDQRRCAPARPA